MKKRRSEMKNNHWGFPTDALETGFVSPKRSLETAARAIVKDAAEYELRWEADPDTPKSELYDAEGFEDVMFLFDTDHTRGVSRINLDEAALLWRSIKQTEGTVVEIGSRFGGTTAMILMALRGERKLCSIDVDPRHNPNLSEYMDDCKQQGVFEMLISDSGTTPVENIGMLFIDGDHSYEGVTRDIRCHWANVVPGGLVLFHDGAPNNTPGYYSTVEKAINELVAAGEAERLSTVRSMVAVKKVGEKLLKNKHH